MPASSRSATRRFSALGAYTAGLLVEVRLGRADHRPAARARWSPASSAMRRASSSSRFRHLALIMITLGIGLLLYEAANSASWLTGGADGLQGVTIVADLRRLPLRSLRLHRLRLFAGRAVPRVPGRAAAHQFAVRPVAARHPRELRVRMPAIGAPSRAHLRKIYTIAAVDRRHRRRAAGADHRDRRRSKCSASSARPTCW